MLNRRMLMQCAASLLLLVGCKPMGKAKGDPFEMVQNGMGEKQVISIMGSRPVKRQKVSGGEAAGGEHYLYRWLERNRIITITFSDGAVIGKAIVK